MANIPRSRVYVSLLFMDPCSLAIFISTFFVTLFRIFLHLFLMLLGIKDLIIHLQLPQTLCYFRVRRLSLYLTGTEPRTRSVSRSQVMSPSSLC
jgi:hypothetical protein